MHIPKRRRIIIIGVSALFVGILISLINGLSLLLGLFVGFGMFICYVHYFEMPSIAENSEFLTERYRYLSDEPPYIVARAKGFRGQMDWSRQVIALYEDRLVVADVKTRHDVPDEIFTPDGAECFAILPQFRSNRIWQHAEIESVDIHKSRIFQRVFKFTINARGGCFRFTLPDRDGTPFAIGLEGLLGGKICHSSDTSSYVNRRRVWAMLGICIVLDLVASLCIWLADSNGSGQGLLGILAMVRDGLGPTMSIFVFGFLLLFLNMLLMLIASLDPAHGGPDSEA